MRMGWVLNTNIIRYEQALMDMDTAVLPICMLHTKIKKKKLQIQLKVIDENKLHSHAPGIEK